MYINYNVVNGIEYGTATRSVRKGSNVGKGDQIYLGRVIDKEKVIFNIVHADEQGKYRPI